MALIKCEDCGAEYSDKVERCPKCSCPNPKPKEDKTVWWSYGRLLAGILSLFYIFVLSLASLGGTLNTTWRFIASILVVIAGIFACITHKSRNSIITIIPGGLYWLAAIISLISFPSWGSAIIPFLFGLVFVIDGSAALKPAIENWKAKNKKEA